MKHLSKKSLCALSEFVRKAIQQNEYISITELSSFMPPPNKAREELNKLLRICDKQNIRLIEVERIDNYRIFICIPNGKSECDYIVWRYSPNLSPDLKVPTHDDLGKEYVRLKNVNPAFREHLISAVFKLIKDRWSVDEIIHQYFASLEPQLVVDVRKFLATLKWIALQEDVNYPPPNKLGSKFTLAVYLLLEGGFELRDVRRLLRF